MRADDMVPFAGTTCSKAGRSSEQTAEGLILQTNGQVYGHVRRMVGDGRCEVTCFDNVERLCRVRGRMRKNLWVQEGDVVLVSLRDFEDEKADIIHRYSPGEAKFLCKSYACDRLQCSSL